MALYLSFVYGCLGSNSAPPAESLHLTLSQDPWLHFAKVKTVPIVCLRRPTPLLQPLYPLPGFSHQIPCMAFGLIVGLVSKIRTLPSSEIHDGLGSWHGDERSRPQWLSPPCYHCVPAAWKRAVPQTELWTSQGCPSRPQHGHIRSTRAILSPVDLNLGQTHLLIPSPIGLREILF